MEVTIVIPVYNRAEFLLRTLQSIPKSYPLIIVDNGSTDGSVRIAEDYRAQRMTQHDAAPVTLATETTPGAAAARNRGLALCTTEWVYFFDSDDEFTSLPEIPAAPTHSAPLDVVCFPVRMIIHGRERIRDYDATADAATHLLNSMLNTVSMLFRTEWLRSIGGWDNRCRVWDDWELGLRALLRKPRLQWITDKAYHHIYIHDDSITGPSYSARCEAIRNTLAIAYDEICQADDQRTLRAFDLRCHIVAGTLRHEGAQEAATAIRAFIKRPTLCGRLIEWYVHLGGRGAWRLALSIL